MYDYACKVSRVIDGDTLDLEVDLGMDVRVMTRVRLNGIDAPEMNTPEGKQAKKFVEDWVSAYGALGLEVDTIKDKKEKYGRYLAELYGGSRHLNADLVAHDHAKPYDGGKRV